MNIALPEQASPIALDDLLIPVKGFLRYPSIAPLPMIVAVHIDETVALGHLLGGFGYQVDAAPGGVA